MKTNKEVVDALQEYFLTQDPKIIARALAGMMIDINRLINIEALPENEENILIARMRHNHAQLLNFVKKGPTKDFKLHNIESEET